MDELMGIKPRPEQQWQNSDDLFVLHICVESVLVQKVLASMSIVNLGRTNVGNVVGGVTRRKIAGLSMIKRGNSRKRESDRKEDKDDKARSNESAPPFGGPFLPPAEVRTVAVRSLGVGMMAPWETELCFRRSPSAKALWDTGASSSLMDQSFARHLVARGVANEFPLTKSIPITFGNGQLRVYIRFCGCSQQISEVWILLSYPNWTQQLSLGEGIFLLIMSSS